jgi:small-conductance mechanosensitive channel
MCAPQEAPPSWLVIVKHCTFLLIVVIAFAVATRLVGAFVHWYVTRSLPAGVIRTIEPDKGLVPAFAHLFDTGLLVVAGGLVVHHFGVEPRMLVQNLLIFALAVSLSIRATVENLWSSFVIHLSHPFRPRDHIRLPALRIAEVPVEGEVMIIGKLATRIRLTGGGVMRIANADLVNFPVVNLSDTRWRVPE